MLAYVRRHALIIGGTSILVCACLIVALFSGISVLAEEDEHVDVAEDDDSDEWYRMMGFSPNQMYYDPNWKAPPYDPTIARAEQRRFDEWWSENKNRFDTSDFFKMLARKNVESLENIHRQKLEDPESAAFIYLTISADVDQLAEAMQELENAEWSDPQAKAFFIKQVGHLLQWGREFLREWQESKIWDDGSIMRSRVTDEEMPRYEAFLLRLKAFWNAMYVTLMSPSGFEDRGLILEQ